MFLSHVTHITPHITPHITLHTTGRSQISLKEISASLLSAPWSGDPFQTPMVVKTLCSLKAVDCNNEKFDKAVEDLLSQRE